MDFTICLTYGLMNGGYNYRMQGAKKPTNITGGGPHLVMGLLKDRFHFRGVKIDWDLQGSKRCCWRFWMSRCPPIMGYSIIIPNEFGSIGPYNKQYTKLFLVSPMVGRLFQLPSSRLAWERMCTSMGYTPQHGKQRSFGSWGLNLQTSGVVNLK
jgi:hypothetical protein